MTDNQPGDDVLSALDRRPTSLMVGNVLLWPNLHR